MPIDDDAEDCWGPDPHTEWRFFYDHEARPQLASPENWLINDGERVTRLSDETSTPQLEEPAVIDDGAVLREIRTEQRERMARSRAKRLAEVRAARAAESELPIFVRPTKRISIDEYMPYIEASCKGEIPRETRQMDAVDVATIMAADRNT